MCSYEIEIEVWYGLLITHKTQKKNYRKSYDSNCAQIQLCLELYKLIAEQPAFLKLNFSRFIS